MPLFLGLFQTRHTNKIRNLLNKKVDEILRLLVFFSQDLISFACKIKKIFFRRSTVIVSVHKNLHLISIDIGFHLNSHVYILYIKLGWVY